MNLPDDRKYCRSHEWIESGAEIARVGISDHAQEELSDIVYVEAPKAGRVVAAGEAVAVVESVKSASDIYAPVAGEIAEVNAQLDPDPGLLNADPYGKGWIFKIAVANPEEMDGLLDAAAYRESLG
ncbi:MAG: glycine cleavage system protein GcvH [Verrucomicrobiales bacterium]